MKDPSAVIRHDGYTEKIWEPDDPSAGSGKTNGYAKPAR
jgi:hypothetical protein